MDFNFVNERLAVGGGVDNAADVQTLEAAGITHVIDMRAEFDDHQVFLDGKVSVLWLPQDDNGTPRPPDQVLQGIGFALDALKTMGNKVYVHCAAGINRGPTECYAILRATGTSKDDAIALIRAKRPVVSFYLIDNYVNSVEAVITGVSK